MFKTKLIIKFQLKKIELAVFMTVLVFLFCGCTNKEREIKFEDTAKEQAGDGEKGQESSKPETTVEDAVPEITTAFVYVCGAVNNPGVYELQTNSRVFQAIEMAGGFTQEAYQPAVNLAGMVTDGQQLLIPTHEQAEAGDLGQVDSGDNSASAGTSASTGDNRINLNTADVQGLSSLSGIGASKAQAIIQYREEYGLFQGIDDLKKVTGIGEKTYDKIKDDITVD